MSDFVLAELGAFGEHKGRAGGRAGGGTGCDAPRQGLFRPLPIAKPFLSLLSPLSLTGAPLPVSLTGGQLQKGRASVAARCLQAKQGDKGGLPE